MDNKLKALADAIAEMDRREATHNASIGTSSGSWAEDEYCCAHDHAAELAIDYCRDTLAAMEGQPAQAVADVMVQGKVVYPGSRVSDVLIGGTVLKVPNGELHPAPAVPVATVCLRGERYAHSLFMEVQLQLATAETELPIGTKLYTSPPVVEIDEVMVARALCATYGVGTISDYLRGGGDEEYPIMHAALTAALKEAT